ncbi:ATP-dependent DNA ligase [Anaerosacchariphilus polymeriproducens]|uniref:DNA ligase (ATP) n=1 Tax=Anaerosacchariphilus polymeriproducens TaxID=1812858 RepID=A0A371ASE9_9FIRM|nr:RNA ligase family protein [Anaerosacchariphilus polymeriproducens]RDU22494.1 DNA ligase [Anaerosacchariphilus polymeriproducens]
MDLFEQKDIKPMLISEMMKPFNSPEWIYELKLDGLRCIAYLDHETTELRNKRNMRLLPKFPELHELHKHAKSKCILDGELVVMKEGVPDFYELQRRTMLTDTFKMQLSFSKYPAGFVAYDILYMDNREITDLPLIERKSYLESVIQEHRQLAVSRYIKEKGIELFQLADEQKLEGVVAKQANSKYYFDKRTKDWIKFKRMADEEFVICGYKPGNNTLVLGQYKGDMLVYKGSVSFGVKSDFINQYNCKRIGVSPFNYAPAESDEVIWLEPNLVCIVEYMPNTKDALRQPVFKGIRTDVMPKECQVR